MQKKEDPGAFIIPWTIGLFYFAKALCDLGHLSHASLHLNEIGIGWPIAYYNGISAGWSNNEEAHWDTPWCARKGGVIYISNRFCDPYCEVDFEVPIILRRSFLSTSHALVDMEKVLIKFRFNNEKATFNIFRSMKHSGEF